MAESLVHFLADSAQRAPHAVALTQDERRTTYADLWRGVTALAQFFKDRGLAPGARVALLLENSPEYVVSYYGILAAGGIAVALNTAAKARDLGNWLRHSGAAWLIADAAHPELSAALAQAQPALQVLSVRGTVTQVPATPWLEAIATDASAFKWAAPPAMQAAAIVYTSGTTGQPKGVTLSHANLASNTRAIVSYLKLTQNDLGMNVLPFFYSYGSSVLHTHLAVGAGLILENSLMYPHALLERMAAAKVTGFAGVAATFSLLLSRTRLQDYDLRALRYLTQAGGAMAPAQIARLRQIIPHAAFFVMYGQTEATARLSYLPPEKLSEKLGSCGIAIPGVELEVRDAQAQKLPPGAVGEIWARGPNIMLGYWNDPQMTQQVLQQGWLKTGDLAHLDADGYLFIRGRASDMIKSGAHRINPREIEEVIAELAEVAEVAVVGVADDILGETIRAVVVARPAATGGTRAVLAHCKKNLAAYKVPKFVDFVEALPKTASGKVKRFMLSERPTMESVWKSTDER